MQLPAHAPAQGGVDELVLSHPAEAAKGGGNDPRGIVVAIPRKVANLYFGVGESELQGGFQLGKRHGHF